MDNSMIEISSLSSFTGYKGTFESIKDNLFMRLFNKKNLPSGKDLSTVPYINYMDLAITFSVECKDFQKDITSCYMLTNEDIEDLNISKEILYDIAKTNLNKKNSVRIRSIQEHMISDTLLHPLVNITKDMGFTLEDFSKQDEKRNKNKIFNGAKQLPFMPGDKKKDDILFISNRRGSYAPINLTFNSTIEEICDRFEESFYIVPLSIHEIVCVREGYITKKGQVSKKEVQEDLIDMTEQINEVVNKEKEVLSYNVYYHSTEDCCTCIL